MPVAIPVTAPIELTVAIPELLLLQMPPEVTSANEIADPTQTEDGPVIGAGSAATVIVFVT